MLKERIFRSFVSNLLIAFVVLGVFGLTYLTVEQPAKANPEGAIHRGASDTKVALLFLIDGASGEGDNLDPILKILDTQKVQATFALTGTWVIKNDEKLQKIVHSGHEVQNAGYFAKDFATLGAGEINESILTTHKLVEAIAGVTMRYFLPPTGTYTNETLQVTHKLGYQTILWTHDSKDTQLQDGNAVVTNATQSTKAGDFVLLHASKMAKDNLEKIIQVLKDKSLLLDTLSNVIE
ncbi:MAG: polysaccharide deacetylase family protein [Firmicutes bacterium]|nr:polysaccharide deacetylase family protein [Bacillota bacterium]